MNAPSQRPAYTTYLPLRHEAGEDTDLESLLSLYETFLSGYRAKRATTHFTSRRPFAAPSAPLGAIIAGEQNLDYDAIANEFQFDGPMTVAERARLQTLATSLPSTLEQQTFEQAVEDLYQESYRLASPRRLLTSRVLLNHDTVNPGLAQAIDAEPNLQYDSTLHELRFSGSMSPAHRDRLLAIVPLPALSPDARIDFGRSIESLFQMSQGQEESVPGLDELLDDLDSISDPIRAPAPRFAGDSGFFDDDFLNYLARWVGIALRRNWPEFKKRRLVRNIVPLYKRRGTLEGIRKMLGFFVERPVEVTEELGFQVAVRSTIGRRSDTIVGGRAHMFFVEIPYGFRTAGQPPQPFDFSILESIRDTTHSVLNNEKPAHTGFDMNYRFPGFIIADYSTVGFDSLVVPLDLDISVES